MLKKIALLSSIAAFVLSGCQGAEELSPPSDMAKVKVTNSTGHAGYKIKIVVSYQDSNDIPQKIPMDSGDSKTFDVKLKDNIAASITYNNGQRDIEACKIEASPEEEVEKSVTEIFKKKERTTIHLKCI